MIVGSGVRAGGGPHRLLGGAGIQSVDRARWSMRGAALNRHVGEASVVSGSSITDRNGIPSGYLAPSSWSLPIRAGGMASRGLIAAVAELVSSGAAGFGIASSIASATDVDASAVGAAPLTSALAGSGTVDADLTAQANLVVALAGLGALVADGYGGAGMDADLTGTGALTGGASAAASASAGLTGAGAISASASGGAALVAALAGSGDLAAALVGVGVAAADLAGVGTMLAALYGRASISADLAGALSAAFAPGALGNMEADITQSGEALSPQAVADAVWSHLTATQLVAAVELVRQISDNRLEVDISGQRLVLYDDDGTTELREWPLSTDGGEDVATAAGVQTRRGAGS